MSLSDINNSVLISFVLLFDSAAVKARCNSLQILVNYFLESVKTAYFHHEGSYRENEIPYFLEEICTKIITVSDD